MRCKGVIFGAAAAVAFTVCGGEKLIGSGDTLVFMGDSITEFGVARSHGYVNLVVKGLAANNITPTWYGAGVQGNTAAQMLARFDYDSGGKHVTPYNPTVVTIAAGVNDTYKERSYADYRNDMLAMIGKVKGAGAKCMLLSPTTQGFSSEDVVTDSLYEYVSGLKQIAADEGVGYARTHECFQHWAQDADSPVLFSDKKATCADGVHMSPAGDRQIARATLLGFGLDTDELAVAEAAWNSDATLVPLVAQDSDITTYGVKLTATENATLQSLGLAQILARGIPSLAADPAPESEDGGAANTLTISRNSDHINYKQYDQLIIAARKLGITVQDAIKCAILRGVRDTSTLESGAPVVKSAAVHPGSTTATIEATIESVGATAGSCDVFLRLNSGASERIVVGESATFDYLIENLQPNTTYTYELKFMNNATTAKSVTESGSFTTLAAGPIQPSGDDDTATLQAAIAAAAPNGTVTLAGGVFNLYTELTLDNGVTLAGQGMTATILRQHSSHRVMTVKGGAKVEGVTIEGARTSDSWCHGAGAYVDNGTISHCRIWRNRATGGNCYGVGVYFNSGSIDHSVITGNIGTGSGGGGGIGSYNTSGTIAVDACLIYGNSRTKGRAGGAAFVMNSTQVTIRNTTIADNTASAEIAGLANEVGYGGKVTLVNSIVAGNTVGSAAADVPGTLASGSSNNVTGGTPSFVDAANGDYHLDAGYAEAIGTGVTYAGIGTDLDDTAFADPPSVGCYEFKGTAPVVTPTAPTLGTVTVSPSSDKATLSGSITSVGNNGATSCDVYLSLNGDVESKILSGKAAGNFIYTISGLTAETTYSYSVTVRNNAATAMTSEAKTGSFTTAAAPVPGQGILPGVSAAENTETIQTAIDTASPGDTVTLGEGIFEIDSQLMVSNGVTLAGQGWDKTIVKQVGTPTDSSRVVTVSGGSTVKRLTLTGGCVNTTANNKMGGGALISDGTISWCCITNNSLSCGNTGVGGGVVFENGKGQLDHSIVADNSVRTISGDNVYGGGIGVYLPGGAITIDACLVCGNRTSYNKAERYQGKGGGIGIEFSGYNNTVTVRNTTIVGNSAGEDVGSEKVSSGGGIYSSGDSKNRLTMVNCIVAGNTTVNNSQNDVSLSYSGGVSNCLFDKAADKVGTGSKSGDPKFTDGYALASDSPARGAGVTYSGIGVDLAGADFADPPSMGCYEFGGVPPIPVDPIELGEPTARPSTNYNGSVVSVVFTGDIPDGAEVSAKVTLDGQDYAGVVDPENGTVSFVIPDDVVTAGNVYEGQVVLTVGTDSYTKSVTLAQGTVKVDENTAWIKESASAFNATGAWTGDRTEVASGKISVSNATFAAATPAPKTSVVTIASTFAFGGEGDEAFESVPRAGIAVVKVAGVMRYEYKTATGAVTNLSVVAKTDTPVRVVVTLDTAANTVAYSVDGAEIGSAAMTAKEECVSSVRYVGATEVAALDGAYRYEGLDANLAKAGGVEYATVEDAVADWKVGVELLWDTTWEPSSKGDFTFTKNGFALAIGGPLAYSVKDNGNGTITVTVTGGDDPTAPTAASITIVGGTVRVGVADVSADCWYALERTTDLTQPFVVDAKTWTKGSELLAGDKELTIALGGNEPQAFYRVVVSATAP